MTRVRRIFEMEIPIDEKGNRITIGRINIAFWAGYDGKPLSNRAEKDSIAAKAWHYGRLSFRRKS